MRLPLCLFALAWYGGFARELPGEAWAWMAAALLLGAAVAMAARGRR